MCVCVWLNKKKAKATFRAFDWPSACVCRPVCWLVGWLVGRLVAKKGHTDNERVRVRARVQALYMR